MHRLPFPVDAAVTDRHSQPILTDGIIGLFGNEVVQTVHDGRIAGDMNHDVAMFGLESFGEVRQAVGPCPPTISRWASLPFLNWQSL